MSSYARWEDALVAQTRLLEHTRSKMGGDVLDGIQESLNLQHRPDRRLAPGFIRGQQEAILQRAEPIYVSEDVRNVIDVARQSIELEPLTIDSAFTDCGFALLPAGILLPDSPADDCIGVPVRAISWAAVTAEDDPSVGCFWVSYYTHVDDDRLVGRFKDSPNEEGILGYLSRHAPLSLAHTFQLSFNDEPWSDPDGSEAFERRCPSCNVIAGSVHSPGCSLFTPGSEVLDDQVVETRTPDLEERGRAQMALIQTFWRIAAQVFRGPERAPRGIWKDAIRRGVDRKDVTVIRLRAVREGEEYEPSGRVLSVQFIVRGHWHTYHTKDGPIKKWVMPFVKGPDGAPFKMTDRVWEFVR